MTVLETVTAPSVSRKPTLNRTLWTAQIVMALFFGIASAGPKLLGEATTVAMFHQMGPGAWFRYLVGTLELAGAIGLVIPRLTRAAALGLIGVMIGATYTQLFVLDTPVLAITPVVLGIVFVLIVWGRRPQTSAKET